MKIYTDASLNDSKKITAVSCVCVDDENNVVEERGLSFQKTFILQSFLLFVMLFPLLVIWAFRMLKFYPIQTVHYKKWAAILIV